MEKIISSFRDPAGFVYKNESSIYRSIQPLYFDSYNLLMNSGLYEKLITDHLLISHEEIEKNHEQILIKPVTIPFISYPYEWSFSQLKDAALLTLKIQKLALEHNLSLKDASSYNIQFYNNNPIFIDTLSFEPYQIHKPWIAYKQFCQHFLAPLILMSTIDINLNQLLKTYLDGIPLTIASHIAPVKTYFTWGTLLHLHLHAKAQKKYENITTTKISSKKITLQQLYGLIDSLESTIISCTWKPENTEWVDYYQDDSYTKQAFDHKNKIVSEFLALIQPKIIWDFGANDGHYSKLAAHYSKQVLSFDIDPACVENNYKRLKKEHIRNILPLLLDITNPSPAIGWANQEREQINVRGKADCILALALIHHLAISNNIPLHYIASYIASLTTWLIIEFIPKTDKKIKKLLSTRKDIFPKYTQENFEQEFSKFFIIQTQQNIIDSERVLYLMKNKTTK